MLPSTRHLASLAAARNPWPKCGLGVQGFGHASTCAVGTFPARAVVQLFFFACYGQIPGKGEAMVRCGREMSRLGCWADGQWIAIDFLAAAPWFAHSFHRR